MLYTPEKCMYIKYKFMNIKVQDKIKRGHSTSNISSTDLFSLRAIIIALSSDN